MTRIVPREESERRDKFYRQGVDAAAQIVEAHGHKKLADSLRTLKRVRNPHKK